MALKRGYKQTEVGVIPQDWEVESLGGIGSWLSGGTPRMSEESYWNGDVPWVSPKDMKVARLYDSVDHVSEKALGNGTRLAPCGAVLMVVRGMILAHSLPVARAERPLAFNQDIKAIVVREGVESDFILRWLQANETQLLSLADEATHGTKRMPSQTLFVQKVALPPRPEQRAIAAALSDVDALLGALDQLIAKKRDVKQAAMQQLLTGQCRLPGFGTKGEYKQTAVGLIPQDWELRKLGEKAAFRTGPFGSALHKSDYTNDGIPIINPMHIVGSRLVPTRTMTVTDAAAKHLADFRLKPGDIVIGRRGDMGRCAVAQANQDGWICGTGSMIIRCTEGIVPEFLQRVISSPRVVSALEDGSVGSTMTNLNQGSLARLKVQLPTAEEQAAIAAVLSDMDAEIAALEARRDKTRALKQAMMQELLTGRIRLV
jgi:type I restriction enzyme S subunit